MYVHTGAIHAEDRLGHEGGVQAVQLRNRLERVLEGNGVVRCLQGTAIAEIDLVLPDGYLVVRRFHVDPHILQGIDHLLSNRGGKVGGEIEVPAVVVRQWAVLAVFPGTSRKNSSSGPV
jgi:hypothetical protein